MDVEVENAFDTELISILIACEIAKRRRNKVKIHSDCNSAIRVGNGSPCARWLNVLNGWKRGEETVLVKVEAHPERRKKVKDWDWDDKWNWIADRVAGGRGPVDMKVGRLSG